MAVRINELRQRAIEARKAAAALLEQHLAACQAASPPRGFSEEERKAQAVAEAAVKSADELVKGEERRLELETPKPGQPSGRISVGAPNADKDPKRGFRSTREFLSSVLRAGRYPSRTDERLRAVAQRDPEDEEAEGEEAYIVPAAFTPGSILAMGGIQAAVGSDEAGEYSDQFGGALVPTTRLPGLLTMEFEGDPTAGLTQPLPMQTPTVEIPSRVDKDHSSSVSGGFTVSRNPETVAPGSTRAQFEMVTMKAAGLFGLSFASEYILSDSPSSFIAILETGFRTQFGAHILNEKLRGKGGNEYLGILTALSSANLGPTISIAKEGGQIAKTIVANNAIKMAAQCWGFGDAVWLANHDTKPQMYTLSIPVGVGGTLIYTPSRGVGFPDMLLGRPVFYTEFAGTVGDQGDLILANMSQFLEGIYQPLQSAESVHVRFLNHERAFKFWIRNAGAPWWRVPLTPAKSASKLSPFVVLDPR